MLEEDEAPTSDRVPQLFEEVLKHLESDFLQQRLHLLQNALPFLTNRREKRRRQQLLQELYVAKNRLQEAGDIFALAFVDAAAEAIINGDWKEARDLAEETFNYTEEVAFIREIYQEKHAVFRDILQRAVKEALPSSEETLTVSKGGAWGKSGRESV